MVKVKAAVEYVLAVLKSFYNHFCLQTTMKKLFTLKTIKNKREWKLRKKNLWRALIIFWCKNKHKNAKIKDITNS